MFVLRLIGSLWVLPVAIPIWLFYLLPFWGLGWHGRHHGHFFVSSYAPRWYEAMWDRWAGLALPFAIITSLAFPFEETLAHERRHLDQWLVLGPLFPLVYGVLRLAYGYEQNPLEVDARRAAGEA